MNIWECTLVLVPKDNGELPHGFDSVPRRAVIEAIENAGFSVLTCFSGWGGTLTETQGVIIERDLKDNWLVPRKESVVE